MCGGFLHFSLFFSFTVDKQEWFATEVILQLRSFCNWPPNPANKPPVTSCLVYRVLWSQFSTSAHALKLEPGALAFPFCLLRVEQKKKKKKKFYKDITLYRRVVWLYSSNVAQAEYFLKINGFHWMIDRGREVPLQPLTTQVNNQLVVHWGSWLVIDWSLIQGGWMEVRVHLDFSF